MPRPTPVTCPICGKETDFFAAPEGPFCSARCKLVDLGKWFGEEYRISEPLRPDHFTEFEQAEGDDLDRT
jgi:endogenous inhibitor of DNA gyrase (YacG/DUF329 family)